MNDQVTTVMDLRKHVAEFVAERDWQQFHDPKNLAASILIEAAELMEHFQWLRSDQLDAVRRDAAKCAEIREEAADVLAFLLSFANALDIDLSAALADKMKKNAKKYPAEEFRGRFQ
ncbi:MAG: nucleotide pyrophosphohydrolase [Phycisphaerales bacterium]|nr:nucleotide pyrophosphohydrolase [Phycisphaerales bacterium]